MRFILLISLLGCTEYELKAPVENNIPPDTSVEEEEVPLAPVAVTNSSQSMKRYELVSVSGEESYDPDNENAQLTYQWAITESPEGSLPSLDTYDTPTAFFTADMIGRYVLTLTVTDEDGLVSENPAATMIEVTPYENLIVEVTWDTVGTDLDLHLLRENGTYYGEGDCFFGNPSPDWGEIGNILDNPVLAIDDLGTEARERIEIKRPVEQDYAFYVLYYSAMSSEAAWVYPTLTVWGEGQEIASIEGPRLLTEGSVWIGGVLDWETMTFTESTTVTDNVSLGGPNYNQ